jgi:SnoaL-like domain
MTELEHRPPVGGVAMGLSAGALVVVIVLLVAAGRPEAGDLVAPADPAVTALPPDPPTAPAEPAPNTAGVSKDETADVLSRYVDAYTAEDPAALTALMTDDVVRVNGDEPATEGSAAAADVYAAQFEELDTPTYALAACDVTPGKSNTTALCGYAIASANAETVSGAITFQLVRADGAIVLIERIEIAPA